MFVYDYYIHSDTQLTIHTTQFEGGKYNGTQVSHLYDIIGRVVDLLGIKYVWCILLYVCKSHPDFFCLLLCQSYITVSHLKNFSFTYTR